MVPLGPRPTRRRLVRWRWLRAHLGRRMDRPRPLVRCAAPTL